MIKPILQTMAIIVLLALFGCSAKVDQSTVRASVNIPEAARVNEVDIALDNTAPTVYMTVEPVQIRINTAQTNVGISGQYEDKRFSKGAVQAGSLNVNVDQYQQYFLSRQIQIHNQMNSAIAGVKNFKLMDYDISKKNEFNIKKSKESDLGLYIVRAVITEVNDQVQYSKNKTSVPTIYTTKDVEIKKIIGLDIQVVDPKTGEIVQAFPSKGSYIYKDASVKGGLIVDFSTSREIVQSSIDQALRVALNNAATRLYNGFAPNNKSIPSADDVYE